MGINLQLDRSVGFAYVFLNVSDFLEMYSYDTSCEVKLLLGSPQQHNSENKYGVFSPCLNRSLMPLVSNGEHLHHKAQVICNMPSRHGGELRYRSALEGGGWSTPGPGRFTTAQEDR